MSQWHHARGRWGQRRGFSGRSSAKRKGGKHILERWKDYLPVEQRMPGTRFIAFKVPFRKDLQEIIPYLKICTIGHLVPDDHTIFKFQCAVKGFLKENKDNDRLIGVHCTHGLNRTGYHICRYLVDVEGMWADDAIGLFNTSRGHCLERQNYIENLQNGLIRKKFSQNQNIYQRGHIPTPGPHGEDCLQRRYSWNVEPNASQAAQNRRWYPGNYYRLPYPTYYRWTK
ncbi:RNA/RNP complex-1-interacting phosphatase-like isoform X3 [Sagmatias obliquidens]|uniref:RNA/RNP complex-1-interacting phosphatase-like isoform X3 n=1 Tax=Sagmatias obliquidens TaxID=3371155 RepID=UPI000F445A0B|nr:RNA/RNP complex-1-interacting phosphatase-like isoform X3 [Lagenorhynchus obliquidens]